MSNHDEFSAVFSANSFYIARRMRDLFGSYASDVIKDDEYKVGAHIMLYTVMQSLPNFEYMKFKVVRGMRLYTADVDSISATDYPSYWIEVMNRASERVAIINLCNPEFTRALKDLYREDPNRSNYMQSSSEIGKCMTEHALITNTCEMTYYKNMCNNELLVSMH